MTPAPRGTRMGRRLLTPEHLRNLATRMRSLSGFVNPIFSEDIALSLEELAELKEDRQPCGRGEGKP